MKIGVLGFGSWGTGLSILLNELGHEITIYGRNKEYVEKVKKSRVSEKYLKDVEIDKRIFLTNDYEEAIFGKEIIILAVASQSVREVLDSVNQFVDENQLIVNLAKGIEIGSLKTISQIVEEYLPNNSYVVLSGPSHAEEVAKKLPTTLVAASKNMASAQLIQDNFASKFLRIYTNPDVIGVEIGGALKNIIALGAGITDGLGYGDNTKAALMTRGINEIAVLGKAMGASQETFRGLSGIGDLIVTCTSMHSRNRRCGILIGQGKSVDAAIHEIGMVVEGIYTVKSAYDLSMKLGVDAPITKELYRVLYENKDPNDSVIRLMERESKHEMENNHNW
ncbi:MAG: NAD(P)H-dependent glycerol-3-phosphate dehydrogenase [Clostridiales bacterium]|nr:NAD(P)H-dependent glycerol-3-phosphate dehydrogenase [Clostridiales bacterium]